MGLLLIGIGLIKGLSYFAAWQMIHRSVHEISLGFSSINLNPGIELLLIGLMILALAFVFDEGRKMQDDATLTI